MPGFFPTRIAPPGLNLLHCLLSTLIFFLSPLCFSSLFLLCSRAVLFAVPTGVKPVSSSFFSFTSPSFCLFSDEIGPTLLRTLPIQIFLFEMFWSCSRHLPSLCAPFMSCNCLRVLEEPLFFFFFVGFVTRSRSIPLRRLASLRFYYICGVCCRLTPF